MTKDVAQSAEARSFKDVGWQLQPLRDTAVTNVPPVEAGFVGGLIYGQQERKQEISHPDEKDPNNVEQHMPGAKLDAGKLRAGMVLGNFSRALRAVCSVGTYGASKYSDHGWLNVIDGINRFADAHMRHWLDRMGGEEVDRDSRFLHLAHEAWNKLAELELTLREHEKREL